MRFPALRPLAVSLALAGLAAAPLAGCTAPDFISFPVQSRGNMIDADQMAQLVVGITTRTDVVALIGTPTAHATFDDNTWLYIGEMTKPVIGGTQAVRDQKVVSLVFDQGGVLRSIKTLGQDDGKDVAVVNRATPAPGSSATLLQQLLGNVGRFSASPTQSQDNNNIGGVGGANKF